MQRDRLVEWNRFFPSKFASSGSRLEYYEIVSTSGFRQLKLLNVREVAQVNCIQWCPYPDNHSMIAYGCVNSVVGIFRWDLFEKSIEKILNPVATVRKPCTGVSWNPLTKNQLAACFEKQRGDYCASVWDIETSQEIAKLYVHFLCIVL